LLTADHTERSRESIPAEGSHDARINCCVCRDRRAKVSAPRKFLDQIAEDYRAKTVNGFDVAPESRAISVRLKRAASLCYLGVVSRQA
jgi:hypothetical protein